MRLKAALIIILIIIAATAANYYSSLVFTTQNLNETMERDQSLVRDIADSYVGAHIRLLQKDATEVADSLGNADSRQEWPGILQKKLSTMPQFIAFSVYSQDGIIEKQGRGPSENYRDRENVYLDRAFYGISSISTTFKDIYSGELVFYLYMPMSRDMVLVATMPGFYFSTLLGEYRLWETGSIYLIDGEGTLIAHYRNDWVEERLNYIELGTSEPNLAEMGAFFKMMLTEQEGTGIYSMYGYDRICSFRHITNPAVDWVISVVAPLNESPSASVQQGLLLSAIIFVLAGMLIAFFLAGVVVRPFVKIEAQNVALEELNKTVSDQAAMLQDEHERTKLLLDGTPLACSLWNANHEMFLCNDQCVRLFEVKDKQEFKELFFDVLSPEFQADGSRSDEKIVELIDKVFSEGSFTVEWMHQTRDGKPLPVEVTLVPVVYEGKNTIAGYVRDMREYREMMAKIEERDEQLSEALDDAQRANEAKSEFLAKMSHEMRTPLNAILGLSTLTLESDELDKENRENIKKVNNAGAVLLSTVNDILDISKIEAGKYELNSTEYDISSLINDVASQSSMYLGSKPVDFQLDIDAELPKRLFGDELRIKQVFNNLLSNAFKYTKEGTVRFEVNSSREGEIAWITACIRDTGIGIKPEDIGGIFEDYVQTDSNKNRGVIGTGLGLSIVKRLLELMHGSIVAESEYGKGSAFRVMIPQEAVGDDTIGPETANNLNHFRYTDQKREIEAKLSRISLPYARVLVVDDFPTNLDVAKGLMKPYQMTIDCMTSGSHAIEAMREEAVHYDAIFMDQMMPEMDGIETTRHIREIGTDYAKNIPIIALTADAIVGNEKMYLEKGFQAFVPKPIEISRLDSVIREFVRDKAKEKQYFDEMKKTGMKAPEPGPGAERRRQSDRRSGIERRALFRGIDGIDINKGIERFGGDKATYFDVLRSFSANTQPLLESAKKVNAENLHDYAIVVHGIKGSSRGICANEFGDIAEKLEMAAKENDLDYVVKHNGDFIDAAWRLIADIDSVLSKSSAGDAKPKVAGPSEELLGKLLAACENYDMDGADKAVSELQKYEYESGGEMIEWLWENVEQMNFSEIVEKLSSRGRERNGE